MIAIPTYIRQRGFRKWYERELVRSHAHLVLLLLCTVALLGAFEAVSLRQGGERVLLLVASFGVAGVLGVWSLRRYLFHLMRAEMIANQAVCPQCKAYGRWLVEGHDDADEERGNPAAMAVRCRRCDERWRIEW